MENVDLFVFSVEEIHPFSIKAHLSFKLIQNINMVSSKITLILIAIGEVVVLIVNCEVQYRICSETVSAYTVFVPHRPPIRCTLQAENNLTTIPNLRRLYTYFDSEMVYIKISNLPNDPLHGIV